MWAGRRFWQRTIVMWAITHIPVQSYSDPDRAQLAMSSSSRAADDGHYISCVQVDARHARRECFGGVS